MMMLNMLRMVLPFGFRGEQSRQEHRSVEVASGDFSDAYFHARVHEGEQQHCLCPDLATAGKPF